MPLQQLQNGRYRLLHLIGQGGMGEVYLAWDTRIDRQVAIKVIRTEISGYPNPDAAKDANRLFLREAKVIAGLNHPHILPLFDFGEEQINSATFTYMVMPYCPEGSLASWLRQRASSGLPALSPQDVGHLIRQAADALQYAHDNQVVHRDVKPSNFLIRTNSNDLNRPDLMLADFGIAKLASATSNISHTIRGTPTYMAPEQWNGQPVPATDQYALAVMAYELVAGRPPFQGAFQHLMFQHSNDQPPPPSTFNPYIHPAVDRVLLHALEKDPAKRFPFIGGFANAFQQALQYNPNMPLPAPPPPVNKDTPKLAITGSQDIYMPLPINYTEALTGTTRTLTLPDGRHVTIAVPAGAYDGQVLRPSNQDDQTIPEGTASFAFTVTITSGTKGPNVARDGHTVVAPPPPPPSAVMGPPSSPPPAVTVRPKAFAGLTTTRRLLLVGLALLLILVTAAGIFSYSKITTDNTNAAATATAAIVHANATQTAITTNYPFSNTVVLSDPLHDNSKGYNWDTNVGCSFTSQGYVASATQKNSYQPCIANSLANLKDFTFEVEMTIMQGDCGALIFRANNASGQFYYFLICQGGYYSLYSVGKDAASTQTLINTSPSGFPVNLKQTTLVAVEVKGDLINLFINKTAIGNVTSTAFTQGHIGIAAESVTNPTNVLFTNAHVWTL